MANIADKTQKLNFKGSGEFNEIVVVKNTSTNFTSSVLIDDSTLEYASGENNLGAAAFIISGSSLAGGITGSRGGILTVDQLEAGKVYPIGIRRATSENATTHIIVLKR